MNLRTRWAGLWQNLPEATSPASIFDSLVQAYREPQRAYHTLDHVQDCLEQLDWCRALTERPLEVELALWFHDVVYDPHAADNEAQSAARATLALQRLGLAPEVIARVSALIMATQHQAGAAGGDAALIMDIDLSILGRTPEVFDRYEAQIRQEYQWVAEADFRSGRLRILERFLRRAAVFQTAAFQARYEAQAWANLTRSISALRGGP